MSLSMLCPSVRCGCSLHAQSNTAAVLTSQIQNYYRLTGQVRCCDRMSVDTLQFHAPVCSSVHLFMLMR